MSATTRFSQTPPDEVNELFDKLLATSVHSNVLDAVDELGERHDR
jgi:hypothetical protein